MDIPHTTLNRRKLRTLLLSPFVERHRDRLERERLDPRLSVALRHGLTTPDRRLFYLKNPKCGCTAASQLLHLYAFGQLSEGDIHLSDALPSGLKNWRTLKSAIDNPQALKFSFVRHPVDRLRSSFVDFFIERRNNMRFLHWHNMLELGFKPDGHIGYNFDVFLDYVALNFEKTKLFCEQHWRMQHICLGSGTIAYDIIGRVENFAHDLAEVFSRAGLHVAHDMLKAEPIFSVSANSMRPGLTLTRAQLARIRSLYATDFETYGYD